MFGFGNKNKPPQPPWENPEWTTEARFAKYLRHMEEWVNAEPFQTRSLVDGYPMLHTDKGHLEFFLPRKDREEMLIEEAKQAGVYEKHQERCEALRKHVAEKNLQFLQIALDILKSEGEGALKKHGWLDVTKREFTKDIIDPAKELGIDTTTAEKAFEALYVSK